MNNRPATVQASPGDVAVAVVGVGHLGRHHARIFGAMEGAHLAAVCDVNAAKAIEVAQPLGASFVEKYQELEGLVKAVSIAVPTNRHHEVAGFFLSKGIDVLLEKPMTAKLDEARMLVEQARQSGRVLMVGQTERFNPAIRVAAKHLDSPRFIEAHRIGAFPGRSTDIDVVLDIMIHDIDLVLSIDRTGVKSIEAVGVPVLTRAIDIANARMRMNSGCVANLTASRVSQEKLRKIRFFGRSQYLSVDCDLQKVRKVTLSPGETGTTPSIVSRSLDVCREEPLRLELESFIETVRSGGQPEVDASAGMESLKTALAIVEQIDRAIGNGPPSLASR